MKEWLFSLLAYGWGEFHHRSGARVLVRFRKGPDDRLEPYQLHFPQRDDAITSNVLRAIPLGTFEAIANERGTREMLLWQMERPTDEYDAAEEQYLKAIGGPAIGRVPSPPRRPRLKVPIPKGRKRPDVFYERVADAYLWLLTWGGSKRPAEDLAEINGVQVTTIHRWIKEARRREVFAPGRRGSAG